MDDLRHLFVDGPCGVYCPYCNAPGGTVPFGEHLLHQYCYEQLGVELEDKVMASTNLYVRTDDADVDGYPIEDRDGNVLGYSPTAETSDVRVAVAAVMGVTDDDVRYVGDEEDENGPVEVWSVQNVVPASR